MIDILQILLFAAHMVSVGIGSVGPLFCVWLDWRACRAGAQQGSDVEVPDAVEHRLARQLAVWSIVLLVVGALLGAAQLAVMWVGPERFYFDLLGLIPARRLWFAGVEWLFSIGCMVLYLVVQSRMPRLWYVRGFVALLGATNSLYHFPILFAVVTVLGFEGAAAGDAQVVFTQYLFDEAVLLRAAHFIGAAVIVTAAFLMSLCLRATRAQDNGAGNAAIGADTANTVIQQAGWVALVAVGVEIVLGISMLSVLPDAAHRALLGGNLLAATVFFASVIAVVGSLHHLGLICLGNCDARHVTRLGAYLLLIVVLMSAVRFMSHRAVWRIRPAAVSLPHRTTPLLAAGEQRS